MSSKKHSSLDFGNSSDKRISQALDVANIGVWEWHIPTGRAFFSPRYYEMLGYEPYELPPSYETWANLLHPDDLHQTEETIQAHLEQKKPEYTVEFRMKTKQGPWCWIMGRGKVIERDNQERPVRMVGVHVDIDDLKKVEYKLLEKQSQLNGILQAFNGIIYTCNKDHVIEFTNRSFEEIAGRNVVGELCYEAQHDLKEPCSWCVMDRVLDGETVAIEVQSPRNNRWYLTINNPIYEPDGSIIKKQATIIDITDRKLIEERLELVLESTSDGLWDWDVKAGEAYFSPRFFTMLGYDPVEPPIPYESWRNQIYRDDHEAVFQVIDDLITGKKDRLEVAYRLKSKTGEWRWILGRGKVVKRDRSGQAERIVGTQIDITERKREEETAKQNREKMLQAAKMVSLGTIVSGVSHEINNPLSFITLNAPILSKIWNDLEPMLAEHRQAFGEFSAGGFDYVELKEEVPKLLDYITKGAQRVKKITADLQSYARENPAEMNQELDINNVIEKAHVLTTNMITKSTDCYSMTLQPDLPLLSGNLQRMEQVLINLITNACQSLSDRGQAIHIQSQYVPETERILLTIEDQGMGIEPDVLPHITDPFFTTRRDNAATGLGLSVAAGIVKDHNGLMTFESKPGKGTKVEISFPVDTSGEVEEGS